MGRSPLKRSTTINAVHTLLLAIVRRVWRCAGAVDFERILKGFGRLTDHLARSMRNFFCAGAGDRLA
ncbi:MAG: hypothetical protein ACI8W7_004393 [Gammaproteobacteria bacterium]|jgi:hypothetical protein